MLPNDKSGNLPVGERLFRVLVISGSDRRQYNNWLSLYSLSFPNSQFAHNQAEGMVRNEDVLQVFDRWTDQFAAFVGDKGKVPPGKYRAYGYRAPQHLLRDAQLFWRDIRMRAGLPPKNSSPAHQQELGLNVDQTWPSHESEGEKRRRKK